MDSKNMQILNGGLALFLALALLAGEGQKCVCVAHVRISLQGFCPAFPCLEIVG